MSNTTRKAYVDYIKAIGIILVILGHINFANEPIKNWIYAFHMPIFFFATGLTIKKKRIDRALIVGKIQSILVPYMIWALIFADYSMGNIIRIEYASYYSISSSGTLTSLWFLPTLFIAVLVTHLILSLADDPKLLGGVAVVSFIISTNIPTYNKGYPWCADVALAAVSFILLGYIYEKYVSDRLNAGGMKLYIIQCLLGLGMTFLYKINPINSRSYILMANRRIGDPVLFFAAALGGCSLVYGVSKIIEKLGINSNILSYIGANTLVIFAIQKPIIKVFGKLFSLFSAPQIIQLIITCMGTLAISCILALIVNRFAPCLAGRSLDSGRTYP